MKVSHANYLVGWFKVLLLCFSARVLKLRAGIQMKGHWFQSPKEVGKSDSESDPAAAGMLLRKTCKPPLLHNQGFKVEW